MIKCNKLVSSVFESLVQQFDRFFSSLSINFFVFGFVKNSEQYRTGINLTYIYLNSYIGMINVEITNKVQIRKILFRILFSFFFTFFFFSFLKSKRRFIASVNTSLAHCGKYALYFVTVVTFVCILSFTIDTYCTLYSNLVLHHTR